MRMQEGRQKKEGRKMGWEEGRREGREKKEGREKRTNTSGMKKRYKEGWQS